VALTLPEALRGHRHAARVEAALLAVRGAGAALMAVRGARFTSADDGDQLKTSVDRATEGWVLGLLRASFAADRFLSEEEFEASGKAWTPAPAYWTVDALDGTRSYVEGFDGFCVQVAYVEAGRPSFGVIHEPATGASFVGVEGSGAFRIDHAGAAALLRLHGSAPDAPCFVDSVPPGGPIGALMRRRGAQFLTCGSFGLKLCRVAEGRAHVFAKAHPFKLWDVAPGDVIVVEAGGRVGLLSGDPIRYDTPETRFDGLLAARSELFDPVARELVPRDH
jgi:3'(2'), 5'-bisphosphate nucleotidase